MSLFTENMQLLTSYSKKIDKATATEKDAEALKNLIFTFENQAKSRYFDEKHRDILTTIAAAELEEVREVIALNAAIKETSREINAARRREAAANKKRFIDAYIYSYGTTKTYAAAMYKKVVIEEGNTAYYNAIIDSYRQDCHKAFYND